MAYHPNLAPSDRLQETLLADLQGQMSFKSLGNWNFPSSCLHPWERKAFNTWKPLQNRPRHAFGLSWCPQELISLAEESPVENGWLRGLWASKFIKQHKCHLSSWATRYSNCLTFYSFLRPFLSNCWWSRALPIYVRTNAQLTTVNLSKNLSALVVLCGSCSLGLAEQLSAA